MIYSYFRHPNKMCMSYIHHAFVSLQFSYLLINAGTKAFIHALFPSLYITSTTDVVKDIYNILEGVGCRKNYKKSNTNTP